MIEGTSEDRASPPRLLMMTASADLYGSDRVLLDVVDALAGRYEVVVGLPARGPLITELEQRGVAILVLPDFAMRKRNLTPGGVLGWVGRVARALRHLARLHRDRPFDLVYSNTLAVTLGPFLRWRYRTPHLWHVHEVLQGPRWFVRVLTRTLLRGSDQVICVSRSVRDQLGRLRPKLLDQCVVVYNGMALPEASPPGSADNDHSLALGCVGRIYPRKGHELLLEAVAAARADGTKCRLELFGTTLPGREDELRSLAARAGELGIAASVEFRGFVAGAALIYPGLDALVLPSVEPEALPLACLEAQAWGLPVIAPAEGGPTEIVVHQETGLLVNPRDVGSLSAAITLLARQPELRRRLGSAGRHRVATVFAPESFRLAISRLVEEALARSVAAELRPSSPRSGRRRK